MAERSTLFKFFLNRKRERHRRSGNPKCPIYKNETRPLGTVHRQCALCGSEEIPNRRIDIFGEDESVMIVVGFEL